MAERSAPPEVRPRHPRDDHPARFRMLALVSGATLAGMSLWFTGTAMSATLRQAWSLTHAQVGWLTSVVQLGFVAGTACAAVLNLADVVPARRYFTASALLAAAANAALVAASSYGAALATRFLTGFFLAGVYPPAMKMAATWFRRDRGMAMGTMIGALVVGTASPYLLRAAHASGLGPVVFSASAAAALGALLVGTLYRDGPYPFPRRPFSWRLVGTVVHHRETRLTSAGYFGHMWELYAMWAWIPAYLGAALARGGRPPWIDLAAFAVIAAGGAGSVWAGRAVGRRGYERVVTECMLASGACSLASALVFGGPAWAVIPFACLWGFFVVADSAQFSALVTEECPPHAVGTALTLQVSVGFLLTLATLQLVPVLADAWGWRWAFPALALGPAAGIAAIARLRRPPASARGRA